MSDLGADIERWAALLPSLAERIPTLIKVTMPTYVALQSAARPPDPRPMVTPRFAAVPVVIDDDLDAPWIAYDQHGQEMGRG